MKISKQERNDALVRLHRMLSPGERIYTILRHRSASGMSRRISMFISAYDDQGPRTGPKCAIIGLDWLVSRALGYRQHNDGGLVVHGCGMDAGFELVYNLGAALWPNGTPEPHGRRNGEPDSAGGYALKHEWL